MDISTINEGIEEVNENVVDGEVSDSEQIKTSKKKQRHDETEETDPENVNENEKQGEQSDAEDAYKNEGSVHGLLTHTHIL